MHLKTFEHPRIPFVSENPPPPRARNWLGSLKFILTVYVVENHFFLMLFLLRILAVTELRPTSLRKLAGKMGKLDHGNDEISLLDRCLKNDTTLWNIWTYQLLCKKNYTTCVKFYTSCVILHKLCNFSYTTVGRFILLCNFLNSGLTLSRASQ